MKFFQNVGKIFWDFLTDKDNNGDEKRFWGSVLIIAGIVKALWMNDVHGGMLMVGTGGGFLTVAAIADGIGPKPPKDQ